MNILEQIAEVLENGEDEEISQYVLQALENNFSPQNILNDGLLLGMSRVGEKFKKHEIFLPDVLMSAKTMHVALEKLKPLLIRDNVPALGKIVIGTVEGDLHDIGKNLVCIMLRGAGFEVIDLGYDVSATHFVETAQKENISLIGMSTLLTTTMPAMKKVVDLIKEKNLNIKTIIGGSPVSKEYAEKIGADEYGHDAVNAVDCVKNLLGVS